MKKQFLKTALITMAVVGVLSGSALAAPITGGIGMSGSWSPVDDHGLAVASIPDASGINFGRFTALADDNTFMLSGGTGSFEDFPSDSEGLFKGVLSTGIIRDFQFESFVPVTEALWEIGGFSFVMLSLTHEVDLDNNNALIVRGKGTLRGIGFDDTPGSWILTSEGASGANYAWSASADASPVPEPATMLLFGSGMIGLAFVGRKIRK